MPSPSKKTTSSWSAGVLAVYVILFIFVVALAIWMYVSFNMTTPAPVDNSNQMSERDMLIQQSTASGNRNTLSTSETATLVKSSSASK